MIIISRVITPTLNLQFTNHRYLRSTRVGRDGCCNRMAVIIHTRRGINPQYRFPALVIEKSEAEIFTENTRRSSFLINLRERFSMATAPARCLASTPVGLEKKA